MFSYVVFLFVPGVGGSTAYKVIQGYVKWMNQEKWLIPDKLCERICNR